MTPEKKLKIQNILLIITVGIFFGLLYNFLFYAHTLTEFTEAAVVSILIGLLVGVLEEFVFYKIFQALPFLAVFTIRTVLYSVLTSVVLCLVLSIEIAFVSQITYGQAVREYLASDFFKRDMVFTFLFIILILFVSQVTLLIGRANFIRLLLGLYHQPREVARIFMFVDLADSTSIAEKMSNKRFSSFIKECFYDLSDAIMMYDGEIYQYVGDEIIVSWPIQHKNLKCIKSFFKMKEIIYKKRNLYRSTYGVIPEFKAGIHAGKVIVTSVGKQKTEIVYHGDVLNTTARIEKKCVELKQSLLISGDMLNHLRFDNDFVVEETGQIELKGKSQKLYLYGIKPVELES